MPLLPLEPFVFPDGLFDFSHASQEDTSRWWVLHTRPRAEKSLARHLRARHAAYFLPLYHRQWKRGSRPFQSYLPLFPGYLFLYGDSPARLAALETNLVARCIPVMDQPQLYGDLTRVHQLLTAGAPLTAEDRLDPGLPVTIIAGPLTGLVGKVLRRGKGLRLFVEVQLLQRGVSVEVETWMIRPIDSACPTSLEDSLV